MLKSFDVMRKVPCVPLPLQALVLIWIGMVFLVIRNTDPIINPIVYTEDGAWIGLALTKGWLHAFINAKEGYFVWGNILLLGGSVATSKIFCDNPLTCLPYTIALWSYFFFASVAAMAWLVTKQILPIYARWLLFFLVLLLPLGDSGNEIIGRISNIGYYCVFITVILMFWKIQRTGHQIFIDFGLLLCAATNPVSLVLIPVLALFSLLRPSYNSAFKDWWKQFGIVFGGSFLILIFIVIRTLDATESSITGSLQAENLIEVALARSILYPYVFPIYNLLSDVVVLILSAVLVATVAYLWRTQQNRDIRLLVALNIVSFVIYILLTLYMRQSLTQQLGAYQTTFPDRYFMGLNVIVLFTTVILAISHAGQNTARRITGRSILSVLLIAYLMNVGWILERENVRMKIKTGPTFREELCLSELKDNQFQGATVSLPIYFNGWSMIVPTNVLVEATRKLNCTSEWRSFFITDTNWIHGIARNRAGFFVPNTQKFRDMYKSGRFVQFADGESREIIRTEINGSYLNIHVRGYPLIPEKVGLPTRFIVMDYASPSQKEGEK